MKVGDLVTWVDPEKMDCAVTNPAGLIIRIGTEADFGFGFYTHFERLEVLWTHMKEMSYPEPYQVEVISDNQNG